ncbi:MAG: tripartite tricarboxylate transporter substrate binding protein [Pigmentiphaga sp.]|nr:tripartite tricarboxylate transporter substrate binding protein [Pigmentiphaga sp.]
MRIHQVCTALGLSMAFAAGPLAQAADFPERPVTIVVPYAPGGPTDTAGRILAQGLQEETGATFIVENAPGAGATVGAGRVSRAAPDGYTILWGGKSTHAIAPHLRPDLQYDAFKSFEPIALVGSQPYIVTVRTDAPYQSVRDLVEKAKASPGELNYSSPGIGSAPHLATELVLVETGSDVRHIPYKGGSPAMMAVLSGEVDFYLDTPTLPKAQAEGGKARLLAVTSEERLADLPDVPTMKESGYDELTMKTWFGLFAPAGTPDEIVNWLNEKVNTVMAKPNVAKQLTAAGFDVEPMSVEQYTDFIKSENQRWGEIIEKAQVTLD